jgi:ubiquinone/menaquinone biosynthesis C-methylase UbiE
MIKITEAGIEGSELLEKLHNERRRNAIGKLIFPVTSYLRSKIAEKYAPDGERLLDIGCGDGYFIKRSKCKERYGLDKLLGDKVIDSLQFPDMYFDYVTMLSVIEFMPLPEVIFSEIHRVLKPKGKLIFTTPRKEARVLIQLYVRNIDEQIESYFDYNRVKKLSAKLFEIIDHKKAFLGLDQVYCLEKKEPNHKAL